MKHKGKITIGRPSRGDGKECMTITMVDDASKGQFLEVELSLEDFTRAISGQARIDCTFTVRGLAHVGKHRVCEDRRVAEPDGYLNREQLEQWLLDNCQEPGWYVDPYLGSQSSRFQADGVNMLRYRVFKYVEPEDGENS